MLCETSFSGDVPTCVSKNSPDVFYWLKAVGHVFSLTCSCVHIQASPSYLPNWRDDSLAQPDELTGTQKQVM